MKENFKEKIYFLTKLIPRGKVSTYGYLAKLAGHKKAARAVGVFMKNNPHAPSVPCHRVVAVDGSLTGYSGRGGINKKRQMLKSEGVKFKGEKVDILISLWDK